VKRNRLNGEAVVAPVLPQGPEGPTPQEGTGPTGPGEGHVEAAKRSEGSEPSRSEAASTSRAPASGAPAPDPNLGKRNYVPDPEVPAKAKRRQYTREYKLKILEEADGCTVPGAIGALLRREGLYSSLLTNWRRERARGELDALSPKKRGRPKRDEAEVENDKLRKEHAKLLERLRKAELIIHVQKKVLRILEIPEPEVPELDGENGGRSS
jgi:transposase